MTSFKFLVTADLHLSNQLPHARPQADGLTDRFNDQLEAVEWMVDLARTHRVDAVVIVGDLYDRRTVDALTLRHSVAALKRFSPTSVLIVPGNHEAYAEGSNHYLPEFFEEAGHDHISFFGFDYVVEPVPWLAFHSVPYASTKRVTEMLGDLRERLVEEPCRIHILFAHIAIQGALVGSWKSDTGIDPSVLEQGFDRVFLGHYHSPQAISEVTEVIGAPWQLNFGESENKSRVLLVEAFSEGKKKLKVESIAVDAPRFHIFPSERVEKVIDAPGIQPGDYVRIDIESTHAEYPEKRALLEPYVTTLEGRGCKIKVLHKQVYHHEDRMGMEERSSMSMEELVSAYPDIAVAGGLSSERLKRMGTDILRIAKEGK